MHKWTTLYFCAEKSPFLCAEPLSLRSNDSVELFTQRFKVCLQPTEQKRKCVVTLWRRTTSIYCILLLGQDSFIVFAPDSLWKAMTEQGGHLDYLTTVKEIHFHIKSRTRLMGLWCTMSGHKLKSEESRIKHTLFWGSHGHLTYFAPARASLCPVKQEERTDIWTLRGWVSSLFLLNTSTPMSDWLPYKSMNEKFFCFLLPVNEINLNSPLCAFIIIKAEGAVFFKYFMVKERLPPDIDKWDLICLSLRWSCRNQLNSLAAIKCDQWQKLCSYFSLISSTTSSCRKCLDLQINVVLVLLSKLKTKVVKYTACLHILEQQTFKPTDTCCVVLILDIKL